MAEAKAQEAVKPDPKAGAGAGGEDLSMEEILHSIRKIIAEDDPDGKKPQPNGKPKEAEPARPAGDVPGSEVLELTEMVKEDGTVESLQSQAGPTDILASIDQALEKKPEKPPVAMAESPEPRPEVVPPSGETLLSAEASASAMDELKKLKTANPDPSPAATTPGPYFRSGLTVEDMVMEMLKPMMKEWLDRNLPSIVHNIVEREVKKLTK